MVGGRALSRSFVAAFAALCLLSACGTSDTPGTLPTADTRSPAPATAPPTPTLPDSPTAAPSASPEIPPPPPSTPLTKAGAEEFVRAFYTAKNLALKSGQVGSLAAYSSQNCLPCINFVEKTVPKFAAEGRFDSDSWTNLRITVQELLGNSAPVEVVFDAPDQKIIAPDGSVVDTSDARTSVIDDLVLNYVDGRWYVIATHQQGTS